MRKIVLLAGLLALVGCDQGLGADQYEFERKEFTNVGPRVTFVIHPTLADLRKQAPPAAHKITGANRELMAWSILRGTNGASCEVHIVDLAVTYQPEWLGHEIAHCLHGRWHA